MIKKPRNIDMTYPWVVADAMSFPNLMRMRFNNDRQWNQFEGKYMSFIGTPTFPKMPLKNRRKKRISRNLKNNRIW